MLPSDFLRPGSRNWPTTRLITVLTVMVAALLLQIVQSYAAQTAARGTAILTVDALNMVLVAVLVFLVLRQVMPIASGLAGGVSLNSFGVVSRSSVGSGSGELASRHGARGLRLRRGGVRGRSVRAARDHAATHRTLSHANAG